MTSQPESPVAIKPKYSGPLSKKFWAAVNRVPRQEGGESLYDLGCVMQEIEIRILRTLNRKLRTR